MPELSGVKKTRPEFLASPTLFVLIGGAGECIYNKLFKKKLLFLFFLLTKVKGEIKLIK